MVLLDSSTNEVEFPRTKASEDEIRLLWDGILDILLERIHHKSISVTELAHLIDELNILLRAVKGRNGVWGSVIDVALLLLRRDAAIGDFKAELRYNESTIYRALARLDLAGFSCACATSGPKTWSISREKCPVLYRATRRA